MTFTADGDGRAAQAPETPWPWSTEQQNNFLFAQIENNFAFGEGTAYDWTGDSVGVSLPQFERADGTGRLALAAVPGADGEANLKPSRRDALRNP